MSAAYVCWSRPDSRPTQTRSPPHLEVTHQHNVLVRRMPKACSARSASFQICHPASRYRTPRRVCGRPDRKNSQGKGLCVLRPGVCYADRAKQKRKFTMHQCPKCQSGAIHRSRSRNTFDVWRKQITGQCFYRCHTCGWRGLGPDPGPRFTAGATESANRAVAPDPVDLTEVLFDESRPKRRPRLNLKAIDRVLSLVRKPWEANARRKRQRKKQA